MIHGYLYGFNPRIIFPGIVTEEINLVSSNPVDIGAPIRVG